MKVAWFTPFGVESAIGRYSAAILDELVTRHEVTVFATGLKRSPSLRPGMNTVRIDGKGADRALAAQIEQHEIAVYNLGDFTPFHGDIHKAMQQVPGVAIVHDVANFGLFWGLSINGHQQGKKEWLRELEYSHGPEARAWGERLMEGLTTMARGQEDVLRYTFLRSCVRGAVGVVSHGEWARQAVQAVTPAPVVRIEFPRFLGPTEAPSFEPRGARGANERVRLLTFGAVNPNKAVDLVIEVIATSPRLRERVQFTVAGGMGHHAYVSDLKRLIEQNGLQSIVTLVDRPSDEVLDRLVSEADLVVNLRYPHLGECSGSLQEALFHAKPTVVWGHGYYDEFPCDVVVKVTSLAELQEALERLVSDPAEREARARRAYEHARKRFQTPAYCQALEAFLERCAADRVIASWTDRITDRIADFDPGPLAHEMARRIAAEISQLAPRPGAKQVAAA